MKAVQLYLPSITCQIMVKEEEDFSGVQETQFKVMGQNGAKETF